MAIFLVGPGSRLGRPQRVDVRPGGEHSPLARPGWLPEQPIGASRQLA